MHNSLRKVKPVLQKNTFNWVLPKVHEYICFCNLQNTENVDSAFL